MASVVLPKQGGGLQLVGYAFKNGAGYSNQTATWVAVDGATGGSSLTIEETGTYTVMAYVSGEGNPQIYLNGASIGVYNHGSAVSVMELSNGDKLTGNINSSDGNGNGSGMLSCVVLKGKS